MSYSKEVPITEVKLSAIDAKNLRNWVSLSVFSGLFTEATKIVWGKSKVEIDSLELKADSKGLSVYVDGKYNGSLDIADVHIQENAAKFHGITSKSRPLLHSLDDVKQEMKGIYAKRVEAGEPLNYHMQGLLDKIMITPAQKEILLSGYELRPTKDGREVIVKNGREVGIGSQMRYADAHHLTKETIPQGFFKFYLLNIPEAEAIMKPYLSLHSSYSPPVINSGTTTSKDLNRFNR